MEGEKPKAESAGLTGGGPCSFRRMTDRNALEGLVEHLKETARAHHEATGGVNPAWAEWYAEHLIDDVKELSKREMTVQELSVWLADADRRYRAEPPEMSWPRAYATWLLEED